MGVLGDTFQLSVVEPDLGVKLPTVRAARTRADTVT